MADSFVEDLPDLPTSPAAGDYIYVGRGLADYRFALLSLLSRLAITVDINCSANPNYPAAAAGYNAIVTVAGKIGGASGLSVDVGDWIICKADNAGGTQASVGSSWFVVEHNIVGPLLSSNNLSDLANAATARTNLGVYSIAAVDALAKIASNLGSRFFYFDAGTASDINTYKVLADSPVANNSLSLGSTTAGSYTDFGAFASPSGGLGVTTLPSGTEVFVLNIQCNTTFQARMRLYKRTAGGTETLLRTAESEVITGGATGSRVLMTFNDTGNFSIGATDRLVWKPGIKPTGAIGPAATFSCGDTAEGWVRSTLTQLPAMVGDSGSGGKAGLVPAPAAGDAAKFFKGDGTWGTAGGGLPYETLTIGSGTVSQAFAMSILTKTVFQLTASASGGGTPSAISYLQARTAGGTWQTLVQLNFDQDNLNHCTCTFSQGLKSGQRFIVGEFTRREEGSSQNYTSTGFSVASALGNSTAFAELRITTGGGTTATVNATLTCGI